MKIITRAELETILTFADAISAVRDGLIQVAKGAVTQPAPMQILFHDTAQALAGDCHVKAAQADDLPFFVIKLATGFYDNPALGLDVNNGMVLVLSAHTGHPIALLQDEGWLTQMRTAAAGALAAGLVPLAPDHVLGIVGTGTQALFQAQAIRAHTGLSTIRLLGRNAGSTSACADRLAALGFTVDVAATARDLCAASDVVVTVTPSTEPLIHATDLPAHKLHIVAVGADSPGKVEVAA